METLAGAEEEGKEGREIQWAEWNIEGENSKRRESATREVGRDAGTSARHLNEKYDMSFRSPASTKR